MKKKYNVKSEKSEPILFLFGVLAAMAVTTVMLMLCAVIMTVGDMGKSWSLVMSSISAGAGGFFGGIYVSKRTEKRGIIAGLTVGVILSAVILVISLAVHGESFTKLSLIRFLIILLSSCIGGISGKSNKEKRLVK